MTPDYIFRRATIADTETIADHRTWMFAEMGMDTDILAQTRKIYVPWLAERLSNRNYIGILIEYQQEVIAGAGIWVAIGAPLPTLPITDHRRANIVNVYTNPEHRRKGLARQMMTRLLDIARENGYPIAQLHASDAGRPLYESIGFSNTNEFRLVL
jgi:ribosomal protein S18 acetylase RimI-like enzyme